MGGSVSNFPDTQALVDSLKETCDISPTVERVLRLVDRSLYAIEPKGQIYSDSAWRVDNLHISAPGIYAIVLQELDIRPGQSVLNVGSGTGYLSTMFGLLLGSNGVNHGIEVHESNVKYARERVEAFLSRSSAFLERDFCAPYFTVGNIFSVVPPAANSTPAGFTFGSESASDLDESSTDNFAQQPLFSSNVNIEPPPLIESNSTSKDDHQTEYWPTYDRIYVGAMISTMAQLEAILRLLKVGGRLIAPVHDQFHKIERVSENKVNDTILSSVSFVSLVAPSEDDPKVIPPPRRKIERLECLACRQVRKQLREVIVKRNGFALPELGRYVPAPTSHSSSTSPHYNNDQIPTEGGYTVPNLSRSSSLSTSSSSSNSSWFSASPPSTSAAPFIPPLLRHGEENLSPLLINVSVARGDENTPEGSGSSGTLVGPLHLLRLLTGRIRFRQMQLPGTHFRISAGRGRNDGGENESHNPQEGPSTMNPEVFASMQRRLPKRRRQEAETEEVESSSTEEESSGSDQVDGASTEEEDEEENDDDNGDSDDDDDETGVDDDETGVTTMKLAMTTRMKKKKKKSRREQRKKEHPVKVTRSGKRELPVSVQLED